MSSPAQSPYVDPLYGDPIQFPLFNQLPGYLHHKCKEMAYTMSHEEGNHRHKCSNSRKNIEKAAAQLLERLVKAKEKADMEAVSKDDATNLYQNCTFGNVFQGPAEKAEMHNINKVATPNTETTPAKRPLKPTEVTPSPTKKQRTTSSLTQPASLMHPKMGELGAKITTATKAEQQTPEPIRYWTKLRTSTCIEIVRTAGEYAFDHWTKDRIAFKKELVRYEGKVGHARDGWQKEKNAHGQTKQALAAANAKIAELEKKGYGGDHQQPLVDDLAKHATTFEDLFDTEHPPGTEGSISDE